MHCCILLLLICILHVFSNVHVLLIEVVMSCFFSLQVGGFGPEGHYEGHVVFRGVPLDPC